MHSNACVTIHVDNKHSNMQTIIQNYGTFFPPDVCKYKGSCFPQVTNFNHLKKKLNENTNVSKLKYIAINLGINPLKSSGTYTQCVLYLLWYPNAIDCEEKRVVYISYEIGLHCEIVYNVRKQVYIDQLAHVQRRTKVHQNIAIYGGKFFKIRFEMVIVHKT